VDSSRITGFYEKVIKVKADVAAVLDRTAQRREWRRALSRNRSGSASFLIGINIVSSIPLKD
jgi:hypothetical protein